MVKIKVKRNAVKKGYGCPPKEHQFKPGHDDRRPRGRPKGSVGIIAAVKRVLREQCDLEGLSYNKKRTWAEELARSLIRNAVLGNGAIARQLLDRIEGPVITEALIDMEGPLTELIAAMKGAASAASLQSPSS